MLVPEGGFGDRLNAMHDWHHARGIPAVRGQSRRENGRDYISVVLRRSCVSRRVRGKVRRHYRLAA
jgi:hypothetical protein